MKALIVYLWVALWLVILPGWLWAQAKETSALNVQQKRGKGLFLQRCALCHLRVEIKPRTFPPVGGNLVGLFKGSGAKEEPVVREYILKGSPNMPGFQYSLSAIEIDDLIAYLKTL